MSMSATRYLFRHSSIHPIISEWCCCSNFKAAWPVRLCTDFIHKSIKEALPLENRKARARMPILNNLMKLPQDTTGLTALG